MSLQCRELPSLSLRGEAVTCHTSWAGSSGVLHCYFLFAKFPPAHFFKNNDHFVVLIVTIQSVECNRRKLNFFPVVYTECPEDTSMALHLAKDRFSQCSLPSYLLMAL